MEFFIYNKNKIKKESRYDENGKLASISNYIYDEENGKLIKKEGKLYKNGVEGDFEANYEYDEGGKLIKAHSKATVMGIKTKMSTVEYVYNDNNLLIKEISNLPYFDTVLVYEYDNESKLLKKYNCYMNDVLASETIYEYDKTKIVKETTYDKDGKQKNYFIYIYDDNGNLSKKELYIDDTLSEYVTYEYEKRP